MSNRLKPEQFGQQPKQPPQRLDAIMEKSLAEVCKDWMADGKVKGDAIQWIARRFDPNGDLNLRQVATQVQLESGEEFFFEAKQVFSVDADRMLMTAAMLEKLLSSDEHKGRVGVVQTENVISFMTALTEYNHYCIWRMAYATEDNAETIIMGACLGHDGVIESGSHQTSCVPLPVLGCVMELLVTLGVLKYSADMV